MQVLITGASGFVGSLLSDRLLREGHAVRLLLRSSSSRANLSESGYSVALGDLSDKAALREAVRGVDLIFHVAGAIMAARPEQFYRANSEGTRNLAEAAVSAAPGLKRFIYVSSLAAGGPGRIDRPRTEADPEAPVSDYGRSKLGGELVLRELGAKLPSVVVRPPVVYGPRDRGMLTFFQIVAKGIKPLIRHNGPSAYSMIHGEDLVRVLLELGMSPKSFKPAEVFYAATGAIVSWEETMEAMAEALGKPARGLPIPVGLLAAVGNTLGGLGRLTGKAFPLSADKVREIREPCWNCDAAKLEQTLGFKPDWSLRDGLRQTALWYRERGWL